MEMRDPVAVINDFDNAWNAHDPDGVLSFFTDDAAINLVPPLPGQAGHYQGREEIDSFVRTTIPGFHVESHDHAVEGDKVTWQATISNDEFRKARLTEVEGTGEARLRDGRVTILTIIFDPDTIARLQAATGGAQG